MKAKTTAIWFVLAAALFAFIWIYERHFQAPPTAGANLFPGLQSSEVTAIQIIPAGAKEISVHRVKDLWQLEKPVAYPAQPAAIQMLLSAFEKLAAVTRLTAGELREHKNADAEFGFENPQFSIIVETGQQRWQLLIGNKTAPGDQVFVRQVGVDGAFVTSADWLQYLPRNAGQWRDTALIPAADACDWIVITNGTKVIELRRDATNQLWRMLRPLPARANGPRIAAALQQLRAAQSAQFITDDPKADLTAYGLQPADLDVWLGRGSNYLAAIHAGKGTTENASLIFARREDYASVVAVAKEALSTWRAAVNDFRDPHLLELTGPIAEIEMRGDNPFTLQRRGSNVWSVAGEKFPVDTLNVQALIKLLGNLRVAEFVKDVATGPDLESFGLTRPTRQVILRTTADDTNSVFAQLVFGSGTNRIFVKRADEDFVYAVAAEDVNRLPEHGWEFRERHLWSFSETNVAQITLHQNGKTRQLVRNGKNSWSLAAGSQGIINPAAVEESVHRLGDLTAAGWVGRNVTEPEKFGLNTNNPSLTAELKSGEKFTVDFGAELPAAQTALAAVTLDSERWAFVFPPVVYQFVAAYLTIPANAP